jgi:hypothetical protein
MAAANRFAFDEAQHWEIRGRAVRSINAFGAIPYQISESHRHMVEANAVLALYDDNLTHDYRHQTTQYRALLDNHEVLEERATALEIQLQASHARLNNVEPQILDLQQRLDDAQDELAESGAAIERSVQQNQELETRIKDFGVPNEDAQRQEEAASAANAQSDEQIARLEREVEELKSREGTLLEANHHHELDVHALEVEKKRLEVALDSEQASRKAEIERLVISHAQEAEKVIVEHQKAIDELKSRHVDDVNGMKQERLAVVEQIQLSHDQDMAKLRTAHEHTLTNTKSKHESHVKKLKSDNEEEIERWQQSRRKLEEERKADLQTLRTVRSQLETSKSDVKSRLVQADVKQRELRKVRQELNDARVTVVDEQKKAKAAQKETLTARDCETRLNNLLKDERSAWERERTQASDDIGKHTADLRQMRTDLQASQKDAASAKSKASRLKLDNELADAVSIRLEMEIQQLKAESAAKTLKKEEAQKVAEKLQSQLHQQQAAAAQEKKKAEDIAKKDFFDRVCVMYGEGQRNDESPLSSGGVPIPVDDGTTSGRPGDNLENALSVSSSGLVTRPSSPSSAVEVASKKRPLGTPRSESLSKRSRSGEPGRK